MFKITRSDWISLFALMTSLIALAVTIQQCSIDKKRFDYEKKISVEVGIKDNYVVLYNKGNKNIYLAELSKKSHPIFAEKVYSPSGIPIAPNSYQKLFPLKKHEGFKKHTEPDSRFGVGAVVKVFNFECNLYRFRFTIQIRIDENQNTVVGPSAIWDREQIGLDELDPHGDWEAYDGCAD